MFLFSYECNDASLFLKIRWNRFWFKQWKWQTKELLRYIPYSTLSSPPPVSLAKSWSFTILLKKNYIENFRIRNYFKKDFLNFSFHYVQYFNHLVTFLEKIPHQFALQALTQVSQSNIFHFTSDHLKSRAFSLL